MGNLTKQTDAKAQVLNFTYDSLNRLTSKSAGDKTSVTYQYDSGPYGIGRLSKIPDTSGQTEFFYDNLGREIKSIKTVSAITYTVERTYDALDRLTSLKYPDNSMVFYEYNPQGIQNVHSYSSDTNGLKLYLNCNGSDGSRNFIDATGKNVSVYGNAQIDTDQYQFGGASGLFDGNGDYLSLADSDDWSFGSEDFTIDFWVRFNALPSSGDGATILSQRESTIRWYVTLWNRSGTYEWHFQTSDVSNSIVVVKATTVAIDTWYHIAVVRDGNNFMIFQDGVQVGTTVASADSVPDVAGPLDIGTFNRIDANLNGWLDELRISKGIARWTSNFTPPDESDYSQYNYETFIANIDYSPTGQITKIVYGNGTETNYAYNPNTLRLSHLTTGLSGQAATLQDLQYQFDNVGNISNIADSINTATQSFNYDDLNRLIQAQGAYGAFSYTYDSIGNMTNKEGVALTYGKAGKLPHAVTQYGSTLIDYDVNGNMATKDNLQYTYDAENRLTEVEDTTATQPQTLNISLQPGWNFVSFAVLPSITTISSVLASIAGKYDQVSRYNSTTRSFEHYVGNSKYDQFSTFEYGKGYQIYVTSATGAALTVTGNIPSSLDISLKSGYNLIACPQMAETPVEEALKPLKLGVDYSKVLHYNKNLALFEKYDAESHEFSSLNPGESYYLYCLKNTSWVAQNTAPTTTFAYDGDGGRVKKTVGSNTTTYIGSLFEKDSSGKTTKYIFSGANRVCTVESTGDKYFHHSDHLGSSNVVSDDNGQQIGLTEFTPYGSVSQQAGTFDPKHKFTGKELDASTGLYFYGARYYDPTIGRFITADTIVQSPYDPQSLNRYSYCRNNPLNYTDPTGHSWKKFWNSFAGAFVAVALAFVLGPAGLYWVGSTMAWAIGGAAGGALTGGLEGGWKGALIGGALGGALGGFGAWGVREFGAGFGYGMLAAGAGVAGATDSWDSFAGGVVGGIAGAAVGNIWNDFTGAQSGVNRNDLAAQTEQLKQAQQALNIEPNETIRVGTRDAVLNADHQLIRRQNGMIVEAGAGEGGKMTVFQYNPQDYINPASRVNLAPTQKHTLSALYEGKLHLRWSNPVPVNSAKLDTLISGVQSIWSAANYAAGAFNSNYAINTFVYGSAPLGTKITGLHTWRPSFSGNYGKDQ
ncbi:MAG: RHS repeat-associated core domain-containing protein [Candidatus Omnitrophota bacterium]